MKQLKKFTQMFSDWVTPANFLPPLNRATNFTLRLILQKANPAQFAWLITQHPTKRFQLK